MPCRVRDFGSICILDIEGKIDINSFEVIETVGWIINSGRLNILCNLENLDMVDYGGLSVLAIAYKNVINHSGKMKFLNVPLPVMELFRMVRLDMVFECYYDQSIAFSSFIEETEISRMHLRRRFKRLDIHLKVKYRVMSNKDQPVVFEGDVLNISGSGIFIYTKHTFTVTSPLVLELMLPGESKPVEIHGKVTWLSDKELQPHSYPGMGIGFSRIGPETERLIADFVEKNVTHRAEG